jgi:hypothetical protein
MQIEQEVRTRYLVDILSGLVGPLYADSCFPHNTAELIKLMIVGEGASWDARRFFGSNTAYRWSANRVIGGYICDEKNSVVLLGDGASDAPTRIFYQNNFDPQHINRIESEEGLKQKRYDTHVISLRKVGDKIVFRPFAASADWKERMITNPEEMVLIAKDIASGNYREVKPTEGRFKIKIEG